MIISKYNKQVKNSTFLAKTFLPPMRKIQFHQSKTHDKVSVNKYTICPSQPAAPKMLQIDKAQIEN